ncbi:MAG: tetratricopeptide repeat protein [Planctomycetota bacterium]|jgi:tetratricopeptide (TPR) repeat protein
MRLITLFTLCLCSLGFAEGERNLELAKKLKERKIERFFSKVEKRDDLDAELKERIAKLKPGAILGGEYGCIHQALLMIEPDYKKADALLLGERFAAAADLYKRIATTDEQYLKAYATFRHGLAEMNRERYEDAAATFQKVLNEWGRYVGCDIESAFYIAVCYGQMRDKENAIVAATRFLEDYPDAPERYKAAMEQMKNELVQEWESPLYDLAGKMNHVGREIEKGETGQPTQGKQKEIIEILNELIKRAEEQEGKGKNKGGGGGAPRGNRQSSGPANKSQLSPGAGRVGDLRGKKRAKAGEKWGEMRDKERDEVLQALKEKFPGRYRELQEQYDRAIAEGKRVTESSGDNREEK